MPLIALLTDFGISDPFVGILKGVITNIAPDIPLVDITHEIPPGDVRRAAITLFQASPYFPEGTVFLCIVDPGVGTSRSAIFLKSGKYKFVGPDNGIFTYILEDDFQVWELRNPEYALLDPGNTFHGRDIFAPAAAYATLGVPGPEFGPPTTDIARLPLLILESIDSGTIRGEILHSDRFGNLLTSVGCIRPLENGVFTIDPWPPLHGDRKINILFDPVNSLLRLPAGEALPWVRTYSEIQKEACAILIGSSGLLEIVANSDSAAKLLRLHGGDLVTLLTLEERDHG